jgi:hypothetical protein
MAPLEGAILSRVGAPTEFYDRLDGPLLRAMTAFDETKRNASRAQSYARTQLRP